MENKTEKSQGGLPPGIFLILQILIRIIAAALLTYGIAKSSKEEGFTEGLIIFAPHFCMFIAYFFYAHTAFGLCNKLMKEGGRINYKDADSRPVIKKLLSTLVTITGLLIAARLML